MKTTGMVRRIDELGRIVIPKEMRKQLMMKEGESIAFSIDDDRIILTKFSLLNKLSPVIDSLIERLYQKYHNTIMVCDLDTILLCTSNQIALYQRKKLPNEISHLLKQSQGCIELEMELGVLQTLTIIPLIQEQTPIGGIIMISEQTPYYQMDENLLDFVKEVIEQEMNACV